MMTRVFSVSIRQSRACDNFQLYDKNNKTTRQRIMELQRQEKNTKNVNEDRHPVRPYSTMYWPENMVPLSGCSVVPSSGITVDKLFIWFKNQSQVCDNILKLGQATTYLRGLWETLENEKCPSESKWRFDIALSFRNKVTGDNCFGLKSLNSV